MSSTAKATVNAIKDQLDRAMSQITPADAREVTSEIKDYLNLVNAAIRRSPHDKHTNQATD
jgi:hypothetical protein